MSSVVRFVLMVGLLLLHAELLAQSAAYIHAIGKQAEQSRSLWLRNCEACHGYGIAGAPVPMEPDDWRTRVSKPKEELYRHAIEGFFGPDDTMMPPRGGNPNLTDEQVRLAVDYMLGLATYYLQQTGDMK